MLHSKVNWKIICKYTIIAKNVLYGTALFKMVHIFNYLKIVITKFYRQTY